MNQYINFVSSLADSVEKAKTLPLGGRDKLARGKGLGGEVLIFAPHPDDECIIGLLPLRLMQQADMRITNIAVTLGSNPQRRAERLNELSDACKFLGWNIEVCGKDGFGGVRKSLKKSDAKLWNKMVLELASKIKAHSPKVIFAPNPNDANATHMGVSALVFDAIKKLGKKTSMLVVLTEFWGENSKPNLLVEASRENLADLIKAITYHVKEVKRNPYHLSLPCWMSNNVRRGAEVVGGQGGAAPSYEFGTIYKVLSLKNGALKPLNIPAGERFLGSSCQLKNIIESWK